MIDDDFYLARYLGGSFGVIEVPGYENIEVYNFNQVVGTTDDDGKVFMPILLPYQENVVAIEPNDLPIGVEIQSPQISVVPYYQSGLLVTFPVTSPHGAIVKLINTNGEPLPIGTMIENKNGGPEMIVASNGDAYLTQLEVGANTFTANIHGTVCSFAVDYQLSDEPIPNLGTVICKDQ